MVDLLLPNQKLTMHLLKLYMVNKHVNMSVSYIIKLVMNWCCVKLCDFSEKTVREQYPFLTRIISVKKLYFS